jgi:hypothetical protein
MILVNRWVVMSAVAMVAAGACVAKAQERARILGVDHREEAGGAAERSPSLMSPRLPKFTEPAGGAARETFVVRWQAPAAGLAAGTLLTFEYRQERSNRVRFLSIRYPFQVQGERRATFEITREARQRYGRVTAWRVRAVAGGRALAELSSKSWR